MAFNEKDLESYVDVAQRIADFREKYPEGSLQPADPAKPWEQAIVHGTDKSGETVGQTFIVYVAAAYRTPDDQRPGIGVAWEVFPGRTSFTRGSELQNAETSAWGRAIVAVLASDSKQGVASRQEVENRRAEREDGLPTNRDGSLSRSRTTDAEKDAAGVMTSAQHKEHTALQPKREPGRVTRVKPCPGNDLAGQPCRLDAGHSGGHLATPADDEWQVPVMDGTENEPGTIWPRQQRAIHKACTGMTREQRMATINDIISDGHPMRQVTSSNELSYTEAATVLGKLTAVRP